MEISSAGRAATIAVNVELNGVDQAGARLTGLGTLGEASANRVQKAYQQVAASAMDFARAGANAAQIAQLTGSSMKDAREAATLYAKTLATTEEEIRGVKAAGQELAESGLLKVSNATTVVTDAAAKANPALNSVRASMTALTASALQTAPGVAQVASVLGTLAIGAGPMIAILAGIAAVGVAYEKLTEASRKAKDEQDKAVSSVKEMIRLNNAGLGGRLALDLDALRGRLKLLREDVADYQQVLKGDGRTPASIGQVGTGFAEIFRVAFGGQSSAQKVVETEKLIAAAQEQLALRFGQTTGAMALQIQRQNELNAAFGKGQLAVDLINHRFDYFEAALRNSQGTTPAEAAALNALARAAKDAADATSRLTEQQRAANELRDITAKQMDGILAGLGKTTVAYNKIEEASFKAARATQDLWQQMRGGVKAAALPGLSQPADWNAIFALPSKAEAQKYSDEIHKIWATGTQKLLTDGLKSWQDFFEDVLQLFSKVVDRMQQEAARLGKSLGTGGKLLGFASAGIAGGIAGYQTGQAIGSPGLGAVGGAAAGALTGAALGTTVFPVVGTAIGAIAGGLAGLTAGLIGGSKAAHDRAMAEVELRKSLETSLAQMRVLAGTATPLSLALAQNAEAFNALRDATEKAYAGRKNEAEREARLRELTALEAQRVAQIQEEAAKQVAQAAEEEAKRQYELAQALKDAAAAAQKAAEEEKRRALILEITSKQNSQLRIFEATGQDDAAFALRQQIELQEQFEKGTSVAAGGLFLQAQAAEKAARENAKAAAAAQQARDAQMQALQAQQQVAEEQVRAAQQQLDYLNQTVDTLRKFSASLSLGNLSPLSPAQKYQEAKQQFELIGALAKGGDRSAIASLQDTVTAFLQSSQGRFASGLGYVNDFTQAKSLVDSVADQAASQIPVQEQILAELQAQNAKLQQQIATLASINTAAQNTSSNTETAPIDYVAKYKEWYESWFASLKYDPTTGRTAPTTDPTKPPPSTGGPGGGRPGGGSGTGDTTSFLLYDPFFPNNRFQLALGTTDYTDPGGNRWKGLGTPDDRGIWWDLLGDKAPGYARGGDFFGGARVVGEHGPELELTGPSRIMNAQQLNADVVREIRTLRGEVRELKQQLVEATDRQTRKIEQTADAQRERR